MDGNIRQNDISIIGSNGKIVAVSDTNQLHVVLRGVVDDNNSTSELLNADEVFPGVAVDILDYGFIFVTVFSDVASAADGLSIEQSSDGTNWDNIDKYTVPANKGKTFSFQPAANYFRIVYTNGGTNQGVFRLQTVLKKTGSLASSHRIQDAIIDDDDAELVKAVLTGRNPGGSYVNFQATAGGNFKISIEEFNGSVLAPKSLITSPSFALAADHYDENTRALININSEHHEIHEGESYVVSDVQSVDTTTIKWQITTPNTTKYSNIIFDMESTGEMLVIITQGSDRTDGVVLREINRNRVGTPTVAGTIVSRTPTGGSTDGAITIDSRRVGATGVGGKTLTGGGNRGINEFVLKPNTKYIVAVTTFADIYVTFRIDWYEHTNLSNS